MRLLLKELLCSAISAWPNARAAVVYRPYSMGYNSYLHCCLCSALFHIAAIMLCCTRCFAFLFVRWLRLTVPENDMDREARLHSFFMQIVCIHIQIFMRTNPFYLLCEQYFIHIYAPRCCYSRTLCACSTALHKIFYNFSDFFLTHFVVAVVLVFWYGLWSVVGAMQRHTIYI